MLDQLRTPPPVRPDFVPSDAYILPDYVKLEEKTLWPKTWLIAARLEEIPTPGDYVTFDIGKESILIVRQSADKIGAFYNVCQHRGRRLKGNYRGRTGDIIRCNFHGWRYKLDGSVDEILTPQDWDGCPSFDVNNLHLKPVRHDTWAGWVWITMDPAIEPLMDYLAPVAARIDPYEIERARMAWYYSIVVPCNWKVVVDAFNEAYHAAATHPSVFSYGWPGSTTEAFGKHGAFFQRGPLDPHLGGGVVTTRLNQQPMREKMAYFVKTMLDRSHCMVTTHTMAAANRLAALPEGMSDLELLGAFSTMHREEVAKAGIVWPKALTPEFLATAATDYHIFPNTTLVPGPDSTLWHRMRPNGDSPDSCIWDIWSLDQFPEGKEPQVSREVFPDPAAFRGRNPFLEEDFSNMEMVQKGMWSRGFEGARTNPVQEVTVSNFHKVLYAYYKGTP